MPRGNGHRAVGYAVFGGMSGMGNGVLPCVVAPPFRALPLAAILPPPRRAINELAGVPMSAKISTFACQNGHTTTHGRKHTANRGGV